MKTFWLTFTDGSTGSCGGANEFDAKQIAEKLTGKTVAGGQYQNIAAKPLPYPAVGSIWRFEHPVNGKCPEFCYTPKKCAGKTSCPNNPSCTS